MTYSYYPGCTLRTKAKDLDAFGRFALEKLGVTLQEVEDWQCCGGAYTMAKDEIASKLSSVRTLNAAKEKGNDLVTLCSACHNVLKQVNNDMKNDANIATKANNYLQLETPYNGETKVLHFLEILRDVVGFEAVAKAVSENENNPLKGKKIGAYYGCLLLRPGKVMEMDNAENPVIMENLIKALGAEPVVYAMRNECCGGYVTMEDKALAEKKSSKVLENASSNGAECLITACPLCLYNLNKNGKIASGKELPVYYLTTLLAAALGNADAVKASAGALMRMDTCKVSNLRVAAYYLKQSGFKLVAATEKTDNLIYDVDMTGPCAIIMGSEGKGISQSMLDLADYKAAIPMSGEITSLNVSVASAVLMYEAVRQRIKK